MLFSSELLFGFSLIRRYKLRTWKSSTGKVSCVLPDRGSRFDQRWKRIQNASKHRSLSFIWFDEIQKKIASEPNSDVWLTDWCIFNSFLISWMTGISRFFCFIIWKETRYLLKWLYLLCFIFSCILISYGVCKMLSKVPLTDNIKFVF